MNDQTGAPNPIKPYLVTAVLDYCRDNVATPYVIVRVDSSCQVPMEYVRDGTIVLDVSDEAVNRLEVSNEALSFQARFGENNEIFNIYVPLNRIAVVTPLEYQEFALRFEVTPTVQQREEAEPSDGSSPLAPPARRPVRLK